MLDFDGACSDAIAAYRGQSYRTDTDRRFDYDTGGPVRRVNRREDYRDNDEDMGPVECGMLEGFDD